MSNRWQKRNETHDATAVSNRRMSDHEHDDERYISVQAVQQVLRVSARWAQRYA